MPGCGLPWRCCSAPSAASACGRLWLLLPAVQADFGVARGEASLPFTLTMVGFGFGGIVMGRLADRFGIVMPMMLGAVALGAGYGLSGVAGGIGTFALAQGLLGLRQRRDVRPADDRHVALVRAPPRHRGGDRVLRQLSFRRDLAADHPAFHFDRRLALHPDRGSASLCVVTLIPLLAVAAPPRAVAAFGRVRLPTRRASWRRSASRRMR